MANLSNINNKFIVTDGGNVGIGNTGPGNRLRIDAIAGQATTLANSITNAAVYINSDTVNGSNNIRIGESGAGSYFLQVSNSAGTTSYAIALNPFGGNVGIGTVSPGTLHGVTYGTTRLHVDGGTDRGQMIIEGDSFAGIVLSDNGTTANERVFATSVDDGKYTIKPLNDNGTSTAGGVAVTVLHGGNVGIGTTGPQTKFQVVGQGGFNDGIGFKQASAQEHRIYATANTQYNTIGSSAPNWIWGQNSGTGTGLDGTSKMKLASNGCLGIGTDSPFTNLEVAGSGLDSIIRLYAAGGTANIRTWEIRAVGVAGEGLLFRQVNDANNSYTNRMIIDTDGNVGIGTISPNIGANTGTAILTLKNTGTNRAVLNMTSTTPGTGVYAQEAFYNGGVLKTLVQHVGDGSTNSGYIKWFTTASGGSTTERMRITSDGRVEVTGNVLSIDTVDEYRQDFITQGTSTPFFDIDLKNVGASGQPFELFVAFTHYSTGYGAGLHQAYYQRSTVQSNITLIHTYFNQQSNNAGAWSVVWMTSTKIRVNKSAGTHGGNGYGYIRVTRLKP